MVDAFEIKEYEPKSTVILENDDGDNFYVSHFKNFFYQDCSIWDARMLKAGLVYQKIRTWGIFRRTRIAIQCSKGSYPRYGVKMFSLCSGQGDFQSNCKELFH